MMVNQQHPTVTYKIRTRTDVVLSKNSVVRTSRITTLWSAGISVTVALEYKTKQIHLRF